MSRPSPRKASREHRRQQIIDATLATIAQSGLSDITLSQIAKAAGISHGLVNFHFESKEKLLLATLQQLSDEYTAAWTAEVERAGSDAARRLDALIRADISELVYTPEKIAAWCAFWGEVKTRQVYRELRAPFDARFAETVQSLCRTIIDEGGYDLKALPVSRVVGAILDENWLTPIFEDFVLKREEKLETMYCCLSAFFPKHFSPKGPIIR